MLDKKRHTLTFDRIAEEKQQAVIDAAVKEFAANGFKAANINTIAEQAGISVGSMYSYFPSKEALFLTVIDRGGRILQKALKEVVEYPGDIFDKYEQMLRVSISYAKAYPFMNQIYLELSTEGLSHLAAELTMKVEKMTVTTYEALLAEAEASGVIKSSTHRQVLAFCLDNIAMMIQFSHASNYYKERMHLFLPDDKVLDEQEMIDALLQILRFGIDTRTP